jgi:basic amino acid/polyamine antiporter, APA family
MAIKNPEPHELKKVLGALDLLFLGIGAVIGAGLFSLTGIAAAENAGPAITISFIIGAIGCAFSGLCYCELACLFPVSGSAYSYTFAAMGKLLGWIMGWNLILEYAIGAATVSISWSAYFVSLLQDLGIALPAALIASPWQRAPLSETTLAYGWINLPAFLIVIAISGLLIKGIKESSIANLIIVALKLSAIFAFLVLGAAYIQKDNLIPYIPENTGKFGEFGWSGIFRGAGILFFAYVGFDSISTAAQETKNPQKNIPIGILGSLAICTLIYVLFGFTMTGLVPYQDLNVAAPVAAAIAKLPFPWLNWVIKLAILCGLTSVILVMLLGQSRIFFAMANDGLFPHWFAKIHPSYHTPWHANLALMLFVGLIGAFSPLATIGSMTSIGTLFAFIMVCSVVLLLRYTQPELERPFKAPFSPFVPLSGIGVCLAMMLSLSPAAWLRFIIWIALGLGIYGLRKISSH